MYSKHLNRITAASLLLFLLLPGCASADASSSPQSQKTSDASVTAASGISAAAAETESVRDKSDLPDKYDLGGFELNIIKQETDKIIWSLNMFAPKEQNGEVLNDAAFLRNQEVTEKYNFTIKETSTADDPSSKLRQNALAGDGTYCAGLSSLDNCAKSSFENVWMNFNDVPNINLEKSYWDQNVVRDLSVKDGIYFMNGELLVSDNDSLMMIMYNRPLADDLGIENLYGSVRGGNWTYDKMESCMKLSVSDLNGDGTINADDRIGLLYVDNNSAPPNFAAAGVYIFKSGGRGLPEFSLDNTRAQLVFEKVNKLLTTSGYSINWSTIAGSSPAIATKIASMIENKQVLFQQMVLSFVRRNFRDITGDFGLLPQPKLDETQENYSTCVGLSTPYLLIPASCGDPEKTGFALEALAAASYDLTDTYYSVCMESKYTRDAESYDMIRLSMKNLVYDMGFTYNWGGLGAKLKSDIMTSGSQLSTVIAAYKDKTVAEMEKAFAQLKG